MSDEEMHSIGERTRIPIVWFFVCVAFICSVGGSAVIYITGLGSKADAHERRLNIIDDKQQKYNDDISAIKESIVRIETEIKE